ncbi:MAG: helix-turn-helix domain-containing protein, partial [Oscillospiraceae bacterium]|nr:helix-turn-helix domain-containing protein [Oscillospiraceae bacterium]
MSDEKKSFGEYIRRQRLEAGLTQKGLAAQLFVTESTISKWERALSYPDVSMVTSICTALHITEHEFFTACDDDQAHSQELAARRWRQAVTGARRFFAAGYAIAIVVCFICDLAVFHRLDWFWI